MTLSRRTSWFLTAFGVWSLIIWTTFVKNLWKDSGGQAFLDGDHSRPTAFFWVHLVLAVTSLLLGVLVGAVGVRGLRARSGAAGAASEA
ncbi:SCO4848 family membrane protein [Kitasatospora sp. NBC_01539]|uniref:SCO4848 family membrane protein n=1 Tax=Kitasatospora sp. NBC_01539 TaxID=2903577 RepID=UPI003860274C